MILPTMDVWVLWCVIGAGLLLGLIGLGIAVEELAVRLRARRERASRDRISRAFAQAVADRDFDLADAIAEAAFRERRLGPSAARAAGTTRDVARTLERPRSIGGDVP